MSILDDILAKEPEQRTVEFIMDRRVREALSEAQAELEQVKRDAGRVRPGDTDAKAAADQKVDEAQGKVDDLVTRARASLIRFTFNALDATAYDALLSEHRPTEAQKTDARKQNNPAPQWNADTFPPAVIAAACVKVETPSGTADGLTLPEAQAMWASPAYNASERDTLTLAAIQATRTMIRVDLPKDG